MGSRKKGKEESEHEKEETETLYAATDKLVSGWNGFWTEPRRLGRAETVEVGRAGGGERRSERREEKEKTVGWKRRDSEEGICWDSERGDDLLQGAGAGWRIGLGRCEE